MNKPVYVSIALLTFSIDVFEGDYIGENYEFVHLDQEFIPGVVQFVSAAEGVVELREIFRVVEKKLELRFV